MKKIIQILLVGLLLFGNSAYIHLSNESNDVSYYGFNGEVKYMKSQLYELIPEKDTFQIGQKISSQGLDQNLELEFNQYGNLIYSKGLLSEHHETKYTYNEKNFLIHKKEVDSYGKGSITNYEYNYDSKDSLIEIITSGNDFKRVRKIERDENNRPIENKVIQDEIVIVKKLEYDSLSNVVFEKEYGNNDDIPSSSIKRTFNKLNLKEKEQIIEQRNRDTLNYENRFYYNKNKKIICEKFGIENDSTYDEIKYRYHQNGNIKEHKSTPKGSDYFVITTRKFNENGDLILLSRLPNNDEPKEIWNYNYKYDSESNWIEKTEYKNNEPLRITKREFKYYE